MVATQSVNQKDEDILWASEYLFGSGFKDTADELAYYTHCTKIITDASSTKRSKRKAISMIRDFVLWSFRDYVLSAREIRVPGRIFQPAPLVDILNERQEYYVIFLLARF